MRWGFGWMIWFEDGNASIPGCHAFDRESRNLHFHIYQNDIDGLIAI